MSLRREKFFLELLRRSVSLLHFHAGVEDARKEICYAWFLFVFLVVINRLSFIAGSNRCCNSIFKGLFLFICKIFDLVSSLSCFTLGEIDVDGTTDDEKFYVCSI